MLELLEKKDQTFEYIAIFINLLMAYKIFLLWCCPEIDQINLIYKVATLMAFELIMGHMGMITSFSPKKLWVVLIIFYGIFALIMSTSLPSSYLLFAYLFRILNTMRFAFYDVSSFVKKRNVYISIAVFFLLFACLLTTMGLQERIPLLGLKPSFLEISGYNTIKHASGVFIDTPHVAMCFGVCYYCSLAIFETIINIFLKPNTHKISHKN